MIRFDNLPPEIVQAMCTPMHPVISPSPSSGGLYIGSLSAANDAELLASNRVTHVVQVLDAPWAPASDTPDGVHRYPIPLLDSTSADLRPHLEAACEHIDRSLRARKNVLVHCQQGVSRSAAVVIAYLIRNQGMTYDSAFALCKQRRACVKPNSGFVTALREWEAMYHAPRPGMPRRWTS
ncbi:protein-tyrosine phosphatase-like protein [Schizophyllum fasciatum]